MPDDAPQPEPPRQPTSVGAAGLDAAASRAPMHERDRVPDLVLRAQAWLHALASNRTRWVLAVLVIILVLLVVLRLSGMTLVGVALGFIDPIVLLLGLFVVNWIGNGGVLVPIPGARFIGLLLIFQNAVVLPAWEVFLVAGAAMALGLLSYYLAGARTARSYADGDAEGAEQLAAQTGMLDPETVDFAPGAELDADTAAAIAGVSLEAQATDTTQPGGTQETRTGRIRRRLSTSLERAQERARPVLEQRGAYGMFLLCFAPSPMGTAAAYLGGLMRFGFSRYLAASFAAKYLLAGIVVLLAFVFNDVARSVQIPELTIPFIDITLFEDGLPELPRPSASPAATQVPVD